MAIINVINRILDRRKHEDNMDGKAVAVYDFAIHGGAVGDIPLSLDLPLGAIIKHVYVNVLTAPTSGGLATIALKIQSAADLLAATAIASFTGFVAGVPNFAPANYIKLTATRTLTLTVAAAALTGGRFEVRIDYDVPMEY